MKIEIPTSIDDIKLEEYQKYALAAKGDSEEDFLLFKTISIFCGVDMGTVSKFPIKDAAEISGEIVEVLNQQRPFKDTFEMEGIEYGFIPNLEEMTLGEYIDLENFLKDPKDLHKAAAVMYRPITKRFNNFYDIETYSGNVRDHEIMKKAPLGIVSAAVVFFYRLGNELLMDFLASLTRMERETETIVGKDSLRHNMVGLTQYMLYPEETQLNSKELLIPSFLQHYSTLNTHKEKEK